MRYEIGMTNIKRIRTEVFGATQQEFGAIAGASQARVARWENEEAEPKFSHLKNIRDEALRRNHPWNDSWFFELPSEPENETVGG